jgi:ATP-binding cassette subfamily F protein 3
MVRKAKPSTELTEEHLGGGHIVVTAQQSRYVLDAVDAPTSKEVRLPPQFPNLPPHTPRS